MGLMSEREEHGNKVCEILDSIWRELSEMLRELINRNVEIPNALRVALDGAKILINLCKHHSRLAFDITPSMLDSIQGFCVGCCGADIVARITCELKTAQDLITVRAASVLGKEKLEDWQKKLDSIWRQLGREYTCSPV